MSQNLPLTGIRVIDYSHFLAGPHMSRCLAAMGADVHVERGVRRRVEAGPHDLAHALGRLARLA